MKGVRKNVIVFLGGGRITSALLAGLRLAGFRQPVVVHDRNAHKLRQFKRHYDVQVEPDLRRAVEQAHLLIVAVRPDAVRDLLEKIGQIRKEQTRPLTAVSLAAGIPLKRLRTWLGRPVRWARAMPSPVARTGRGLTAVTFDGGLPAAARSEIRNFFSRVGTVLEIPETKFDAFTVTYSSSHGYHALSALAEAAEKLGLDGKTALTAAAHALADGVLAWRESHLSLDALLNEAATPGGIAATTVAKMDQAGYKRSVQQGLRAGMARAAKNAKLPEGAPSKLRLGGGGLTFIHTDPIPLETPPR
ncbi:MAG: NAD(P)-binding domain-containing protein [Acidobacteriia bacterium]|jgi:pyrroline-5-carboxylate reductase|nr:NAD(P)-binding domain-containing protein [Terriglobia bacterium]